MTAMVCSAYCTWIKWKWPIEEEFSEIILDYFSDLCHKNPSLWDGQVLMSCRDCIVNDVFYATFFSCNYSTFVAWRDGKIKDINPYRTVRNTSTIGLIKTSDGGIILGRMSEKTSTPGAIVCPGGIPDKTDINPDNGIVDLGRNLSREIKEETGLDLNNEIDQHPNWMLTEKNNQRIILAKQLNLGITGNEFIQNWCFCDMEFDKLFVVYSLEALLFLFDQEFVADYTRVALEGYFV